MLEAGARSLRGKGSSGCVRIAAAGDLHCDRNRCGELRRSLHELAGTTDLVLLCGDLTTHGEPEQAALLAEACNDLAIPVFAVLGNHDWHANRRDELVDALAAGGIEVLDRSWAVCETGGVRVGIVGVKGFVGGFMGGARAARSAEPAAARYFGDDGASRF